MLKKIFNKKITYIILAAIFTLLLAADLIIHFSAPASGFPEAGLNAADMPQGFDASSMPESFDTSSLPENFDASAAPGDFDASSAPDMPGQAGGPQGGTSSGLLQSIRSGWIWILAVCLLGDGLCGFMLWRLTAKGRSDSGGDGSSGLCEDAQADGVKKPAKKADAVLSSEEQAARQKKAKTRRRAIGLSALAVLVLGLALLPKLSAADSSSAQVVEQLISTTAEKGDIIATFSGGGTISDKDNISVSVPGDVKITSYAVENNDFVSKGEPIAYTDKVSVMSAVVTVQELLSELDEALSQADSTGGSDSITAAASGRVKAIYAQSGMGVLDVMYENSALMLLSIDGLMSLDIDAGELETGDSVRVILSDGTEQSGTVARVKDGLATVTTSDETAAYGEAVSVIDGESKPLGEGELNIHSMLKVTGYAGTVASVWVSENSYVSEGRTLLTLTDTDGSAAQESLLSQRRKLEDQMAQLFVMYQDGYISAETDGYVTGIDKSAGYNLLSSTEGGAKLMFLSNNPEPASYPDESSFVNVAYLVTDVSYGAITASSSSAPLGEVDFQNLSGIDTSGFSGSTTLSPIVPVYTYSGGWVAGTAADITVGDLLIYTVSVTDDGNGGSTTTPLWFVRSPSQTGGGGQGGGQGGQGGAGGTGGGMGSGAAGGMSGSAVEEETKYSLADTAICTLTPSDYATISISVDELDIMQLSVGQKAMVTLDAIGGQSFEGTVTAVNKAGTNDGGSTKYSAVVTIARSPQMLSGMNAAVSISLSERDGILLLPAAALVEQGSQTYVYTGYDKGSDTLVGLTQVTTGVSDGINVEIVSGLDEGAAVYYRYADTISYSWLS